MRPYHNCVVFYAYFEIVKKLLDDPTSFSSTSASVRKPNVKTRLLFETPIRLEQLPVLVPRAVAADFAVVSVRTLMRAERDGKLTPIRRGDQAVSYRRDEFLKFLGITES